MVKERELVGGDSLPLSRSLSGTLTLPLLPPPLPPPHSMFPLAPLITSSGPSLPVASYSLYS